MARIRTVKPEFFTHPEIARLSIPARLLLVALWTLADDEGRLYDQPTRIRGHAFAEEDRVNISRLLDELAENERILRYRVLDRDCLAVTGFKRHQVVNRATPSTIPAPVDEKTPGLFPDESGMTHGGLTESSLKTPTGKGKEGKGRERKGKEGALDPDFVSFWSAYPRREDRLDALKAWEKARLLAPVADIIAGAERYRDDPNRDPGYTKLASTWLNKGCWTNPPLPPRGSHSSNPVDLAYRKAMGAGS